MLLQTAWAHWRLLLLLLLTDDSGVDCIDDHCQEGEEAIHYVHLVHRTSNCPSGRTTILVRHWDSVLMANMRANAAFWLLYHTKFAWDHEHYQRALYAAAEETETEGNDKCNAAHHPSRR